MKVTIAYLSCGCVVWGFSQGTIAVSGRCSRCGYSDTGIVTRETRVIREPAP